MMRRTFAAVAALALLSACSEPPAPLPVQSQLQQADVTLRQGERIRLEGSGYELLFNEIKTDSRCPAGVSCVWAGTVVGGFAVARPAMDMSILPDYPLELTLGEAKALLGLEFTLTAVEPPTKVGEAIKQEDYRVTVRVRGTPAASRP